GTGWPRGGQPVAQPRELPDSRSGWSGPGRGPGGPLPKAVWPRGREVAWPSQPLHWIALEDPDLAATRAPSVAATAARPDRTNRPGKERGSPRQGPRPSPSACRDRRARPATCHGLAAPRPTRAPPPALEPLRGPAGFRRAAPGRRAGHSAAL